MFDETADLEQFKSLILHKARRMVGQAGLTNSDLPDLEQSFKFKLLLALASYDPSKGSLANFAKAVLDRHAANLIRDLKAAKRNCRSTISLHAEIQVDENEFSDLSQQVSEREGRNHLHSDIRDELELSQLKADVRELLEQLTPEERQLAEALMHDTVSAVARSLEIPRTTLYWRIKKICQRAEDASLRDYLN
jgi:RNA polymerase sigma factor (sigma-70 family)